MRGCLLLLVGLVVGVVVAAVRLPGPATVSTLPARPDVRIELSDGYLTKKVRARLSSTGIVSVHALEVGSAPPDLVVRAEVGLGPLTAPVTVELRPLAVAGEVQVRITATHIGPIPVPNALTGLVTGSINDSLRHILGGQARVTGVMTTQAGLDITANYP